MGAGKALRSKGTAKAVGRVGAGAVSALCVLSFSLLACPQPAFADEGPVFPAPSATLPMPGSETPSEEPVVPVEDPVPTEEPATEPVQPVPAEPSFQPAVPAEVVTVPPAAVVSAPVVSTPEVTVAENTLAAEAPAPEPTIEKSAEPTESGAVVPSHATPSATTGQQEQEQQAIPVRAVISAATGSPLGVQLITVALLLAAGYAYFRLLGSKGMRTPTRPVK